MDYVGIDPNIGLQCSECGSLERMRYSRLLEIVLNEEGLRCDGCHAPMQHGWITLNITQNIIRRRMAEAHEGRAVRGAAS